MSTTSLHLSSGAATSSPNESRDPGLKFPPQMKGHHIRQIALAVTAGCWAAVLYAVI